MKLGRRSFLRVLGVSPFVGRAAADVAAKELAGIRGASVLSSTPRPPPLRDLVVTGDYSINSGGCGGTTQSQDWTAEGRRQAMKLILSDRDSREEITDMLYRCHARIHSIDHDIGSKRSWSLSAKVTFQRQRVVEQELAGAISESTPWQDMRAWCDQKLRTFLIG